LCPIPVYPWLVSKSCLNQVVDWFKSVMQRFKLYLKSAAKSGAPCHSFAALSKAV
jgi:hypothetical protein